MTFERITLPEPLRVQANSILDEIGQAEGVLELTRLGGIVEGLALGLRCTRAMAAPDVDALEAALSRAIDARMGALRRA
jgi:hypothetical protein